MFGGVGLDYGGGGGREQRGMDGEGKKTGQFLLNPKYNCVPGPKANLPLVNRFSFVDLLPTLAGSKWARTRSNLVVEQTNGILWVRYQCAWPERFD